MYARTQMLYSHHMRKSIITVPPVENVHTNLRVENSKSEFWELCDSPYFLQLNLDVIYANVVQIHTIGSLVCISVTAQVLL